MRSLTLITTVYILLASSVAFIIPPQEVITLDPQETLNEATIDPCLLADSTKVNASLQLSNWLECQINGFYPYPANTHWEQGHASSFSNDLKFTFNDTHYDFEGSLKLYKSFNETLAKAFAPFEHGFTQTLGIPSSKGDRGGFVYMMGWAGGFQRRAKRKMYFTNAAFAVIREEEGQRKIVEFRESSNIPNTARLPEPKEWECHFK